MALIERGEREHLDRPAERFLGAATLCAAQTGACDRAVTYWFRQLEIVRGKPVSAEERPLFEADFRGRYAKCKP
jgi:hypothetical protein